MTHIPYKGMAPALPDLFSGQVAMAFDSIHEPRYLGASGEAARAGHDSAGAPARRAGGADTMAEQGYPSLTGGSWIGLLAPPGTRRHRARSCRPRCRKVIDAPGVHAKLIEYGIDPVGGTPNSSTPSSVRDDAGRTW